MKNTNLSVKTCSEDNGIWGGLVLFKLMNYEVMRLGSIKTGLWVVGGL